MKLLKKILALFKSTKPQQRVDFVEREYMRVLQKKPNTLWARHGLALSAYENARIKVDEIKAELVEAENQMAITYMALQMWERKKLKNWNDYYNNIDILEPNNLNHG